MSKLYPCFNFLFRRNLEFFNKCQSFGVTSVDPELGRGELIITVASEAQHMIQEGRPLRVGVEFSIEKPQAGLHFVVPNCEGTLVEVISKYIISLGRHEV